ncbi:DUF4145 domain-containing protein [Pectobacterium versatile]|uniref:DUF4145 domain-containing protein n=1 Tax=Pectobacterium versatile TaxID=2488639 RepID=UPI001B370C12|nr:DUF4145 domain-containing protein [Pectobacterium versatile]MBQ4790015.1 DUF4145 domain-containing protein [Pectobacterium versatile]
MKHPIYLLKNDIDFTKPSIMKLMSFSYPKTLFVLKEINISEFNSEEIIKRLSLDKDNCADIEYSEERLTIKIDAILFFKDVFNLLRCKQYGLNPNIEINSIIIPKINELNGNFPHYIEMDFARIIRPLLPKTKLSSILKNIYFDERSEIISSVLCMEKVITEIINERFKHAKIEIKNKEETKKVLVRKSSLEQKISFLHSKEIFDKKLFNILTSLRLMRNHAAHDLSLTESIYNETIVELTSKFVFQSEQRYNLPSVKVARFSNCFMYIFDEISSLSLNPNNFVLGRTNSDEWNSFFYGA